MSEQPRPERLSRGRELIRAALENRLRDVQPEGFARLASPAAYLYEAETSRWLKWEGDCLKALILLSSGERLDAAPARQPQVNPFIEALRELRREPDKRYQLLLERYACPLNISCDSEREAREHILEGLMVRDRVPIEKGSETVAASNDVLLKLNLLAIYSASKASTDLRYLDALNYYYEILPDRRAGGEQAPVLYASYLALYARALYAWLNWKL